MTELLMANPEAELTVIGAVFLDNSRALTLDLEPEDFANANFQRLWAMARAAAVAGTPFVVGQVAKAAPEWASALNTACGMAAMADIEAQAHVVRDTAARRRLKGLAAEFSDNLGSVENAVDELVARLVGEASREVKSNRSKSKRIVAESVAASLGRPSPCYPTGLSGLDSAIGGGLFAGKCYGIAARKKTGKTVCLGTISHNLNHSQVPHLFIALEMSAEQIEQRNMAREMGINSIQFLKRSNPRLAQMAADYAVSVPDHTIFEHRPGASWDDIRRIIASARLHHGIKGVFLDYWQLVGGKQKNETEEYHLRTVAQGIADICVKEGLFAVIAAQLNQDNNTRGGEGLKLACDCYFTLHREKDSDFAWLEMEESRYVLYANVGSESQPGLILNKLGPFFEDGAPSPAVTHWTERGAA